MSVLEEQSDLAERLALVQAGIADAAQSAGRDASSITTVVVTKFHDASLVRELYALGVRDFGESRHQEAAPKIAELADLQATWHFVGQLQSKKARLVRDYVDVIHSVDRESLVAALAGASTRGVFLQVNLTDDPARGGAQPDDIGALADSVAATEGLELLGLMAVAPLGTEPRRAFESVRRALGAASRNLAAGIRSLDGHVGRLRGGDSRRRDTPANRYGNNGKTAQPWLISNHKLHRSEDHNG